MKTENKGTNKPRRPTQYEVAKRAGVSQTTVSMIMTNSSLASIPEETRARVQDAVREIGYFPDRSARSLRTRKTYTIAAVIPDITNPFYPAFLRGIQDVTKGRAYDLVIYNSDGTTEEERNAICSVRQNGMDGLIIVPFHTTESELTGLGIPVVQLIQKPDAAPAIDSVFIDNAAAAEAVVSHLLARGHTRIGMIAGAEHTPPHRNRVQGYRRALLARGASVDERLIHDGDYTFEGGRRAMEALLEARPRITAVFAANDLMALGAMTVIGERRLAIPADVAVAGFDDIPAARLVHPALTTVAQHEGRIGARAARLLFERLEGTADPAARAEELEYELIVRMST